MCESSWFNYLKRMLIEHRLANINRIMYFKRVKSCISAKTNDNHIPRKPNAWMNELRYFVITTKNLQDFEGDSASRYAQVMVLINSKSKPYAFFFYMSMRNDHSLFRHQALTECSQSMKLIHNLLDVYWVSYIFDCLLLDV